MDFATSNGFAALFGALVGIAEILNRFQHNKLAAVGCVAGVAYVVLNALASVGTLALIRALQLNLGGPAWQVILAGFGSIMILRSAVVIQHKDRSRAEVGPSWVVQVFLTAAEQQIEEKVRAEQHQVLKRQVDEVFDLLGDLSYQQARRQLVRYAQYYAPRDALKGLDARLRDLDQKRTRNPEDNYVIPLGMILAEELGIAVLRDATQQYRRTVFSQRPGVAMTSATGVAADWGADGQMQASDHQSPGTGGT